MLGDGLDLLLLVKGGGTAADIVIGPFGVGRGLLSSVSDLLTHHLGVSGEVLEQDLGRTEQAAHPLRGEEWAQSAPETETVVAAQDRLDQGAESMRKNLGNVAFGQSGCCQIPADSQTKAAFPFSAKPQPKPDGKAPHLTNGQARAKAVRFWLQLCRAKKYAG